MAVIQGVLFHYLFSILILQVVHGIYLRSGNQFRRGSQTRPQISSAAIIGKCFILYTKSRILLFAVYIYLNVDKLDICSCTTRKSLKNLNSVQNMYNICYACVITHRLVIIQFQILL